MKWYLPLMLAALLAPTTVSADWADDNYGPCGLLKCPLNLCTDDAPPQAVDLVLHCALVTPGRAPGTAGVILYYAYGEGERYANTAYNDLDDTYNSAHVDLATVNGVLCASVWSFFCTNPLEYPEWQDVDDPFGPYPL